MCNLVKIVTLFLAQKAILVGHSWFRMCLEMALPSTLVHKQRYFFIAGINSKTLEKFTILITGTLNKIFQQF